tara:strand:- start:859 stop:1284 length:426 start_codon:yes stop_codon:yes gene_type:complete
MIAFLVLGSLQLQLSTPIAARVAHTLRSMIIARECSVQHFRGSMLGVTASVALDVRTRRAFVELRGVALGGSVSGVGWLKNVDSDEGEVELEKEFEAKLARRMVSIQSASMDRVANTVTVRATVPLFGSQSLILERVEQDG